MRYVFAIASLVLATVLLILGIGQRSFLAGPAEIVQEATASNTVNYGVIAAETLAEQEGQAKIRVGSSGPVFVSYGSTIDVQAWVAPYDHQVFGTDADTGQLTGEVVPAALPEPAKGAEAAEADETAATPELRDPRGSDLWREEFTGERILTVPVDLPQGTSVLVATTGLEPQPSSIELVWEQDRATPLAGPLLLAGGAFALLGAVMYLLAIDHDRRGVGPRRGNSGPLAGIRASLRRKETVAPMLEVNRTPVAGTAEAEQAPSDTPPAEQAEEALPSASALNAVNDDGVDHDVDVDVDVDGDDDDTAAVDGGAEAAPESDEPLDPSLGVPEDSPRPEQPDNDDTAEGDDSQDGDSGSDAPPSPSAPAGEEPPAFGERTAAPAAERGADDTKDPTEEAPVTKQDAAEHSRPERSGERKNSRLRRGWGGIALGLGLTIALTGCSADYWPDFSGGESATTSSSATPSPEKLAPIPVTESQITRIIDQVSAATVAADTAGDSALLEDRLTGPALTQREANYTIRTKVEDYAAPPVITQDRLSYDLIQSTESWPRTLFVTVESADPSAVEEEPSGEDAETATPEEPEVQSPSLALVLTQQDVHSNYQVHSVVEMRGGIEMPKAAPTSEGTALLSPELKTLRIAPGEVGKAYADLLSKGEASEFSGDFDVADDFLIENVGQAWVKMAEEEAAATDEAVKYSVSIAPNEEPVVALSTGELGALVMVTINERQIATSTKEGANVKLTPKLEALSGLKEPQKALYHELQHQMMFYVPTQASGETIRVLGSTTEMTNAGTE